jgi:hypothetical protein
MQPGTHTSIVLDRIRQWEPIVGHCAYRNTHLVFLVHGTPEQAMPLFIKRIKNFLAEECKELHHRVVEIERKHDRILARKADEWKRCIISKTEAGRGEFDTVLPRETLRSSPVYLLTEGGGPMHLEPACVNGLVGLFRGQLDPVVRLLDAEGKLKHPLRFVLPIEHATVGGEPLLTELVDGLRGMRALLLEPLTEISFPPWDEVWEHVLKEFEGADKDGDFRVHCQKIYEEVARNPKRMLQTLGDALHPALYEWEEVDVRRRR